MARPTSYRKTFPEKAERLFATGATSAEVAKALNLSLSTLYDLIKRHSQFSEAVTRGKAVADELVERALFKRATGFVAPDCHVSQFEGKITVTPLERHYPPDTAACLCWLKNRKPQAWCDKSESEITLRGMPEDLVKAIQERAAQKAKANGSTDHTLART